MQEGTKSVASNRTIPLSAKAMKAMEELLETVDHPTGLIFCSVKYPDQSLEYKAHQHF